MSEDDKDAPDLRTNRVVRGGHFLADPYTGAFDTSGRGYIELVRGRTGYKATMFRTVWRIT